MLATKPVCFLNYLNNSHSSQLFSCITDDSRDNEGMHHDVHYMDIGDSESESQGTQRPNKKNPTADVDEFFEKVPHQKGDNKGRRRCKSCMYVSSLSSRSIITYSRIEMDMGPPPERASLWMTVPLSDDTWPPSTRFELSFIKFPFLINGTLTETIPRLVQGQQIPLYAA